MKIAILKQIYSNKPVATIFINHCKLYTILIVLNSLILIITTNIISFVDSIQSIDRTDDHHHAQNRIIGGDIFTKNPWPFFAALDNEQIFCGGAIIDQRFVLTSASCVNGSGFAQDEDERYEQQMYIRTGSNSLGDTSQDAVIKSVTAKCVTTSFRKKNQRYYDDFALLFLNETLDFSYNTIEGAGIYPDKGQNESRWYENADCWTVGLSNGSLNMTSVRVRLLDCPDETSNESVFCFQYYYDFARTCQGDLGDPIICSNNGGFELLGIVSSFVDCDNSGEDYSGNTYRVARFQKFFETSLNDCAAWFYEIWEGELNNNNNNNK